MGVEPKNKVFAQHKCHLNAVVAQPGTLHCNDAMQETAQAWKLALGNFQAQVRKACFLRDIPVQISKWSFDAQTVFASPGGGVPFSNKV